VTTGELRKMSESGLLTTQTVITTLQGQSAAVAAEFQRLPPTVGQAMQDLSTVDPVRAKGGPGQWCQRRSGQSHSTAANNLQSIAGLLMDLGQAAVAFTALRLAALSGHWPATQCTELLPMPSSWPRRRQPQELQPAPAVLRRSWVAQDFHVGWHCFQHQRYRYLDGRARPSWRDKDRTEELEKAEPQPQRGGAARAAEAGVNPDAADKLFDLSKAARNAVAEFEQLTKSGKAECGCLKERHRRF
jgi:hypothetical protein